MRSRFASTASASVLALGFSATEARDLVVLTQSVGMGSAAYMICLKHSSLLHFASIATFVTAVSRARV